MLFRNILSTLALVLCFYVSNSQSAAITIDGIFDDWGPGLSTFTDAPETIGGIDILEFQVTNDDQFLFVKITLDTEIDLTDDIIPHDLMLYIDTDDNAGTGFNVQAGFGSELGIKFRDLYAWYDVVPSTQVNFVDIQMRPGPTVSGTEFEIAIGRDVIPDGVNPLFPSSTIKLMFKEWNNGDVAPNVGSTFSYTFDETPVTLLVPTDINKDNSDFIRIVAYNTLSNGLNSGARVDNFEDIITALDPDIIGFSESGSTTTTTVINLLNAWLPTGTANGWYAVKDEDLITASIWPIIDSWPSLSRQFPALIDLPAFYPSDLLVVNSHLSCCANDAGRQDQVDEFVEWWLDAKTPGGSVELPEFTAMSYIGDLNLVGYAQQLNTLVTGDIVQTGQYGAGGPMDWDGTDITDQLCVQTDKRMAYTWRSDGEGSYPPGRLDFILFTDALMTAEKSFTVQTEIMPPARLAQYGWDVNETSDASDHFPVTTDFSMILVADTDNDGIIDDVDNCIDTPNPDQADWNNDGQGDVCSDSDGDSLTDSDELLVYGTDPGSDDTDNDGVLDGEELNENTNPLVQDTDGDGLTDGLELSAGIYDPTNPDTDGDGCGDADDFSDSCGPCPDCPGDFDGNCLVNTPDLLGFLAAFGFSCE